MPMGIVSDADLEQEIKRNGVGCADPIVYIPEVIIPESPGRAVGDLNVPEVLRKVIAQDAIENGRASAIKLAATFGISPSSVSAYTNGATSTESYHQPSPEINNHVKDV
jgi:hypothetical protein